MTDDWTLKDQCEARYIIEQLNPLVEFDPARPEVRKIFKEKFYSTWENFVSGEIVMHWIGERGFQATMTCRRDCLLFGVLGKYFHKQKTLSCAKSKVAGFCNMLLQLRIMMAEGGGGVELYQRVHCSFQSTSSYKIPTINVLSECQLSNYFRIYIMDHLIKNTNLAYRSWKYWYGAMLHAKGMSIVVLYDMYLEVCEDKMDATGTNAYLVSYYTFRELLSSQMLQYDPKKRH